MDTEGPRDYNFSMSAVKGVLKEIFKVLPFRLQVRVARNRPGWAFHVDRKPRQIQINYYLGKYRFHVDTSVDLERRLLSGTYEPYSMAMIRRFVRPGQTAIDIGANVGAIAFALADAVGEKGTVHAFEPGPPFARRFQANLSANPSLAGRIRLHEVGLSNVPGKLSWQASSVYTGTASMYSGVHDSNQPTLELPVERLDDYVSKHSIGAPQFIKIDVDGLELEILEGARELLERHRPVLYVETTMWNDEMRETARKIDLFLTGLGYELYRVNERSFEITKTRFPDFSVYTLALPAGHAS